MDTWTTKRASGKNTKESKIQLCVLRIDLFGAERNQKYMTHGTSGAYTMGERCVGGKQYKYLMHKYEL